VSYLEIQIDTAESAGGDEFADLDIRASFEAWLESLRHFQTLDETFISSSSSVSDYGTDTAGAIRFASALRIGGRVAVNIYSERGILVVTEFAHVDADISVDIAVINGLVRGNIRGKSGVQLGAKARVIGNIDTPSLTIAEGAIFEGRASSISDPGPAGIDDLDSSMTEAFSDPDLTAAENSEEEAIAVAVG